MDWLVWISSYYLPPTNTLMSTSKYIYEAPIVGMTRNEAHRFENAIYASLYHHISNTSTTCDDTPFRSPRLNPVSLQKCIHRILFYSHVSPEAMIVSIIYLCRVIRRTHVHFVNRGTIHRLLLASVLVAGKYMDDYPTSIYSLAMIGCVHSEELAYLEMEFLRILRYNLHVDYDEYEGYAILLDGSGIYLIDHD